MGRHYFFSRSVTGTFPRLVSALEDKPINVKDRNFPGLSPLSEEFSFQVFGAKFSSRRRSPRLTDSQIVKHLSRISALEERAG
jgi:hypothetical protein